MDKLRPTNPINYGMKKDSVYSRIYALVRRVPHGRVVTYGQISRMAGGCTPRMVGYAMAALPEGSDVPWHRVINSRGEVSERSDGHGRLVQQKMLELEGVTFDQRGRVNLTEVGWSGPGAF